MTELQKKLAQEKCNSMSLDRLLKLISDGEISLNELPKLLPERRRYIEIKIEEIKKSPNPEEQKEWEEILLHKETLDESLTDALKNYINKWIDIRPSDNHVDEAVRLHLEVEDITKKKIQKKRNLIFKLNTAIIVGVLIGLLFLISNLLKYQNQCDELQREITVKNEDIAETDAKISELGELISNLRSTSDKEKNELNHKISSIISKVPIIITKIEVANTYNSKNDYRIETDYGQPIYSLNTMYLKPRITYTGLRTDNSSITLNVRLYILTGQIDNSLREQLILTKGNDSPNDYSQLGTLKVISGEGNKYEFSGWGGENMGYWKSGTYRYEIWYGNVCLGSKTFKILDGSKPVS